MDPTLLYRRYTDFNDIHPNFTNNDTFKFAHGLTGTDQPGNGLCTTIIEYVFLAIAVITIVFRFGSDFHRTVRQRIIAEHGKSQKFWEKGHFPWVRQVLQHSKDRPLRPGHTRDIKLNKRIKFAKNFSLGLLPTRNQFIFTIIYVIANIAFTFWIPWKKIKAENVAALRGRTGHLATFNLIFTTLFAFRNNPLIWAFQVSFDSFNFYHRLFARITIVESAFHVICWAHNTLAAGGDGSLELSLSHSRSYRWGMVSFISFMVILIQAWSPLRRFWYHLFLVFHRILATLAIVGLFLHIYYHDLPQMVWISITLTLLALEVVYRIGRIVYLNFHRSSIFGTKVTVRAFEGACRVTFHLNRPWRPLPGTHAHIYIPAVGMLMSHPFSIAWSTEGSKIDAESQDADTDTLLKPKFSSPTVSFIVRSRDGFTKKLQNLASSSPDRVYASWGLVEGAYGHGQSLSSYGTVVLFAGGVGITHVIPYVRDCVVRSLNGSGACQKLHLVWSVPNLETFKWIRDWLEEVWAMEGAQEMLRVTLFMSRLKEKTNIPDWVEVRGSRCDPDAVLEEEVPSRVGAMAVMVCGPGAVGEAVRMAARKRMTDCSIDMFEESFTY